MIMKTKCVNDDKNTFLCCSCYLLHRLINCVRDSMNVVVYINEVVVSWTHSASKVITGDERQFRPVSAPIYFNVLISKI